MPRDPQRTQIAISKQESAAFDTSDPVFLVAGPGTGKSATIGNRIVHLLRNGATPASIFAVSFTNASSRDLGKGIEDALLRHGFNSSGPSVSTLHSLALRSLKRAGLLQGFASEPMIMDEWESSEFFDSEFAKVQDIGRKRAEEIRKYYEAFLSTGTPNPPNYPSPSTPISNQELHNFTNFLKSRRLLYSSILSGELVHECVMKIQSGALTPVTLLSIEHLIVDEFQDLNPLDVRFVEILMNEGVKTLIVGDDDQSIYGFRYGSPDVIQTFITQYQNPSIHVLEHCFRSTPQIVTASQNLIRVNALPNRIPKNIESLYQGQQPNADGVVHNWKFVDSGSESRAIAHSCKKLIDIGVPPKEIFVLLLNQRLQSKELYEVFDNSDVPYLRARPESLKNTLEGRLCYEVLRTICNATDYVARRVIIGLRAGTGMKTCVDIANKVILNSLRMSDVFNGNYQTGLFNAREERAVRGFLDLMANFSGFNADSKLEDFLDPLLAALSDFIGHPVQNIWNELTKDLPPETTLSEALEFIREEREDDRSQILIRVYKRLERELPATEFDEDKVRVMSLHGSKGLSASIVFIPGLEEEMIPGINPNLSAGRKYEYARLLYVGITRARSACIMSFAKSRVVFGRFERRNLSGFGGDTGGNFTDRWSGLSQPEAQKIKDFHDLL